MPYLTSSYETMWSNIEAAFDCLLCKYHFWQRLL